MTDGWPQRGLQRQLGGSEAAERALNAELLWEGPIGLWEDSEVAKRASEAARRDSEVAKLSRREALREQNEKNSPK